MLKHCPLALALLALAACGDDKKPAGNPNDGDDAGEETTVDAARPDSGRPTDATTPPRDADEPNVPEDSGTPPADTGTPDSGLPPITCDASKAPTVPALKLEAVPGVGSLDKLVFAAQPPGSSDWYLVQQTGQVRVLSNGALKAGNFLDVSSEIQLSNIGDDERGLLGLAFAPDYATSGKLYVMMTPTRGGNANRDSLIEYTRTGETAGMPKDIVRLPASESNHNGGNMVFDADGLMYVGTGDGGGACNNNGESGGAQDPKSLFGKILRLDLKNAAGNYAAAGNPFTAPAGDPRVLHYGLRNPYRFGLDRRTGDLYIGDVGQDDFEEVDFAPADAKGLNFGWPTYEGTQMGTCGNKPLNPGSTATPPIVHIPRKSGQFADYKSVIGSAPYRGSAIAGLQGVLLFGDYVGARYQALVQCGDDTSAVTIFLRERNANMPNVPGFTRAAGVSAITSLVAIVQGSDDELYLVANRNTLLKVVPGT
ncbi:MAG: PQQ-dependent sugar dehydrogenase [Polyangiales bacterium]